MPKGNVKAIPDGMHSITPYLTCDGASDAIAFYKKAFGAVEISRLEDKDGRIAKPWHEPNHSQSNPVLDIELWRQQP